MKKKKGFTLVELLAVIVILAIILVIAVPQIMKTIDESRKGALSSSAKLIAASAEREYLVRETLGDTDFDPANVEMECSEVADTTADYVDCDITFTNGKAYVSLTGDGKFKGKYVCNGTRESAKVTEESCGLVCAAGTTKVVKNAPTAVKPYEVKNVKSCEDYFTNYFINAGAPQEIVDSYPSTICGGGTINNGLSFSDVIEMAIYDNSFTEQELIENNVIKGTIEEVCVPNTDESCFTFDSSTGTITDYDKTCGTDVVIPSKIGGVTVTVIGDDAFRYKEITSVVLADTISEIGRAAFYDNEITHLTIPSSVTYIDTVAFNQNPLEYVNLENQSVTIECSAFGENIGEIEEHNIPSTYSVCQYPE